MARFLCLPLLLMFVLPAFAQVESLEPGLSFARDPAFLTRMREQLTTELQQIQEMLGAVSDPQLTETLKTRQADATKQLLEVMQQSQAGGRNPISRSPEVPSLLSTMPRAMGGMPEMMPPRTPESGLPMTPETRGGNFPGAPDMRRTELYQNQVPQMISPGTPGMYPVPPQYNPTQPWGDLDRMWESTPWGPRFPKELLETKQSVDSLRKEIADLKETIKALETQIQLLSRNILLERMKDNSN